MSEAKTSVLDKLVAANVRVFAEKFDLVDVAWWHNIGKPSMNELIGAAYEAGRHDAMVHVIDTLDGDEDGDDEGGWEQEAGNDDDDDDDGGSSHFPSTLAGRRSLYMDVDS